MGFHRVHFDAPLPVVGQTLRVEGDEAHHAVAVKRVAVGDTIEVLDGAGGIATCRVVGPAVAVRRAAVLELLVIDVAIEPAPQPVLCIASAVPKGGRLDDMIAQLAQLGVMQWRPLSTRHGVVRPTEIRRDRLERIAAESAKQCGRAHALLLGEELSIEGASQLARAGEPVWVADAGGAAFQPGSLDAATVLVGPEGGFEDSELAALTQAGARPLRLGPHVLRIETAAMAAAAIFMSGALGS